jgi:Amidohydrolase family
MSVAIRDATLITVDPEDTVLYSAALAVEGDRIAAIGPIDAVLSRFSDAEIVNGRGKLVMPGFANVHTHFTLITAKGIYEDLSPPNKPPFTGGLAPLPTPRRLRIPDFGLCCASGPGTRPGAASATRAASRLTPGLAERGWRRIERLHARWHGAADGRITVGIAAWAPDMCSPALLRELRALQDELACIDTVHLNQIWGEVAAVRSVRGRLPTEYLDKVGFLDDRLIVSHCRCMMPEEERLLGRSGAAVAFNSAIAARRGLSPRIADLEAFGCTIALGSDNMSEDMGRGDPHRAVHGAGAAQRRPAAGARAGAALGHRERLPRHGDRRRRLARAGQEGRPDRDRSRARAPGPKAARRVDLRPSVAGARRRGGHGGRALAHAGRRGGDDRRGAHRGGWAGDRRAGVVAALRSPPGPDGASGAAGSGLSPRRAGHRARRRVETRERAR